MCPEENFLGKSTQLNTENEATTKLPKIGQIGNLNNAAAKKEPEVIKSSKIKTITSVLDKHKVEFKRPANLTGAGATRVKTFHVRLSESAMQALDDNINEWLDDHTDIEVKFCNTTIGLFEAKRSEPHLIMNIWY